MGTPLLQMTTGPAARRSLKALRSLCLRAASAHEKTGQEATDLKSATVAPPQRDPNLQRDPVPIAQSRLNAELAALRRHRLALTRREGVPPYVIASDHTLREIALLRPRNLQELELVHGIGPAKREKCGAGLLAVVMGGIEP